VVVPLKGTVGDDPVLQELAVPFVPSKVQCPDARLRHVGGCRQAAGTPSLSSLWSVGSPYLHSPMCLMAPHICIWRYCCGLWMRVLYSRGVLGVEVGWRIQGACLLTHHVTSHWRVGLRVN